MDAVVKVNCCISFGLKNLLHEYYDYHCDTHESCNDNRSKDYFDNIIETEIRKEVTYSLVGLVFLNNIGEE